MPTSAVWSKVSNGGCAIIAARLLAFSMAAAISGRQ